MNAAIARLSTVPCLLISPVILSYDGVVIPL